MCLPHRAQAMGDTDFLCISVALPSQSSQPGCKSSPSTGQGQGCRGSRDKGPALMGFRGDKQVTEFLDDNF